jgi:hypothetical protein
MDAGHTGAYKYNWTMYADAASHQFLQHPPFGIPANSTTKVYKKTRKKVYPRAAKKEFKPTTENMFQPLYVQCSHQVNQHLLPVCCMCDSGI